MYEVSAFDETFDAELRKLVLHYSFDFEAIALHLCTTCIHADFKFPQYAFRMKPQAVSYRWYQLTLEEEGPRIKEELACLNARDEKKKEEREKMVVEDVKEEGE